MASAAGRKEFELAFKLTAALGSNFNNAFNGAVTSTQKLQKTLTTLNSTQSKVQGYQKQEKALASNKTKLEALTAEHERLTKEIAATDEPSKKLKKQLEATEKQMERTTDKIEAQESRLEALGGELSAAGVNTDKLTKENERLATSYDKVQESQLEIARISEKQEKNRANIANTKKQLLGLIGVVTALGVALWNGPVQSAMEYETALAKVETIADTTHVDMETISGDILKLSNNMGIGAAVIAEDVYNAISAGQDTDKAVGFLETANKLATGGFAETAQSLDILTTIINAYGMEADQASYISDILIQTQNKGKITVAELAETMGKVIPTAQESNVALDQLGASYAIMTAKGIKGAQTTTYLNSMLNELSRTGSKTDEVLRKKTGKSFSELMESGMNLGEVLEIVQGEAERAGLTIADMFGSQNASKAAISLLSDGVDGFTASLENMQNATGMTEEAYTTMTNTTEFQLQKLKNSFGNIGISLGNVFLPHIAEAAARVSELVTKIADFAAENPEVIATIVKVAGAMLAMKGATLVGKLAYQEYQGSILGVQKVFSLLKGKAAESAAGVVSNSGLISKAAGGLKNYFGGIGSALGGVGSKIASIFNGGFISRQLGKVGGLFSKLGTNIVGVFGGLGGKISGALSPITGIFSKIGTAVMNGPLGKLGGWIGRGVQHIGSLFKPLGNLVGSVFGPVLKTLGAGFGGLFGKIMPIILIVSLLANLFLKLSGEDSGADFMQTLKDLAEQAKPTLMALMEQLKQLGKDLLPVLIETAKKLAPLFGQILTGLLPIALELLSSLLPLLMEVIGQILPVILDIVGDLAPLFADIISQILPIILELLQLILPVLTDLVMQVIPILVDVLNMVMPLISRLAEALLPVLLELMRACMPVIEFLAELFSVVLGNAIEGISEIIGNIMTTLGGLIDFITGVFTGDWELAWQGVQDIFGGIFEGLVNLVKLPINAVIDCINHLFGKIGTLKIPDWVPFVGGNEFSLPQIPKFAKGIDDSPETFIAGEAGAELITNRAHSKVFTALQTGQIFDNLQKAAQAAPQVVTDTQPQPVEQEQRQQTATQSGQNFENMQKVAQAAPQVVTTILPQLMQQERMQQQSGQNFENVQKIAQAAPQVVTTILPQLVQQEQLQQGGQNFDSLQKVAQAAPQVVTTILPQLMAQVQMQQAVPAMAGVTAPRVETPEVKAGPGGGNTTVYEIKSDPTFFVDGGDPEDIHRQFEEYKRQTIDEIEERQRERDEDERRSKYD